MPKSEKVVTFYREEEKKVDKFWELLETSTIFQGAITLLLVLTTCYLWVAGKPVPSELWFANTVVIGFFFGSKSNQTATKIRNMRGR